MEKEDHKAVRWLRMAAEQGEAKAQFILAMLYNEGRGVEEDLEAAFGCGSRRQLNKAIPGRSM